MIELETIEVILLILFILGLVIEGISLIMLNNSQRAVTKIVYLPMF